MLLLVSPPRNPREQLFNFEPLINMYKLKSGRNPLLQQIASLATNRWNGCTARNSVTRESFLLSDVVMGAFHRPTVDFRVVIGCVSYFAELSDETIVFGTRPRLDEELLRRSVSCSAYF